MSLIYKTFFFLKKKKNNYSILNLFSFFDNSTITTMGMMRFELYFSMLRRLIKAFELQDSFFSKRESFMALNFFYFGNQRW